MEALPLRKETIFEGYVVPHYEALLLEGGAAALSRHGIFRLQAYEGMV